MEGEENAESRFFGSTLEERAAQERAKNDAADAPAERKFFGGETLEETATRRKAERERADEENREAA